MCAKKSESLLLPALAGLVLLFASVALADPLPDTVAAVTAPVSIPVAASKAASVKSVKLLTIGNSFADNATADLPGIAKAEGKELTIFRANLDANSLQDHVAYLKAFEANPNDPKGSPYLSRPDPVTGKRSRISLRQALQLDQWDYVTIQQLSTMSYRKETYQPAAGVLIAYIHQYAPKAEILVHETWAYRRDAQLFAQGDVTPEMMYERLKTAYHALAGEYDLRIIPVGDAFQTARKMSRWTFKFPDPKFNYTDPQPGQLPDQTGSLNNGWMWIRDGGKMKLTLDARHANPAGRYLGAVVFYEMLFKQAPSAAYCPAPLQPEDTATLREAAHSAVVANKQPAPLQFTGNSVKSQKPPEKIKIDSRSQIAPMQ